MTSEMRKTTETAAGRICNSSSTVSWVFIHDQW